MNDMMAREIAAQAHVLADIQPRLAGMADALARPKGRIFAGGCGDSAFAPQALCGVFASLGTSIEARSALELAAFTTFTKHDTVILSSISGGTKRTVDAALAASDKGAHIIALTCKADSALASAASETIVLPFAPLSRKTPHTLDYAVTLLALAEIARSFAGHPANATADILAAIPDLLACSGEAANRAARTYVAGGKMVILGAGPDLGTAHYGAAKFHEAGGLIALAAETENFIHGMNYMLDPADTLIALGGNDAGRRSGQKVVDAFAGLVANSSLYLPRGAEMVEADSWKVALAMVFEQTFFLQKLCLQIADQLGLSLEDPRAGRADGTLHLTAQSTAMAH